MSARSRLMTGCRAVVVAAPFAALAALPGLAGMSPPAPHTEPIARARAATPAQGYTPPSTHIWPREHSITPDSPLVLRWGCRSGAGGCRFAEGKLVAESDTMPPLVLWTDSLGLDTFSVFAPIGFVLVVQEAAGVDCRNIAGEPHGVLCTLTSTSASLRFSVAP
jgi:hypothetical protein